MNRTSIEWVKNPDGTQGFTWNPITGCLNHVNGLCKGGGFPCYAYKLANTRLKQRYLANPRYDPGTGGFDDPFYPRFWEERLGEVLHRRIDSPLKGIFPCDMSDLFGIGIPEEWTWKVLNAIEANFYDRFYLLTKQPQNLIKFSPFPDNVWVGVTATNTDMAVAGLSSLSDIEAKVKYISFEPLLSWIPLTANALSDIQWLIIGAQTKPTRLPEISWVREIVDAADKAGVKVFLKDNLLPLLKTQGVQDNRFWHNLCDSHGFEPLHLLLRHEFPNSL